MSHHMSVTVGVKNGSPANHAFEKYALLDLISYLVFYWISSHKQLLKANDITVRVYILIYAYIKDLVRDGMKAVNDGIEGVNDGADDNWPSLVSVQGLLLDEPPRGFIEERARRTRKFGGTRGSRQRYTTGGRGRGRGASTATDGPSVAVVATVTTTSPKSTHPTADPGFLTTWMSGNVPQPQEIEEFLGSFKPSLAHLQPGFMEVGIINRNWLLVVSRWEREHVHSFFSSRYHDVKKGLAPLPAVVVEALVVRFKDE
ncbi:hypothetical protein B0H12DRAFT_1227148, partial [Mycena haematopus]